MFSSIAGKGILKPQHKLKPVKETSFLYEGTVTEKNRFNNNHFATIFGIQQISK